MVFKRMGSEVWFDKYRYVIDCDTGESADDEEIAIGMNNLDKALNDLI